MPGHEGQALDAAASPKRPAYRKELARRQTANRRFLRATYTSAAACSLGTSFAMHLCLGSPTSTSFAPKQLSGVALVICIVALAVRAATAAGLPVVGQWAKRHSAAVVSALIVTFAVAAAASLSVYGSPDVGYLGALALLHMELIVVLEGAALWQQLPALSGSCAMLCAVGAGAASSPHPYSWLGVGFMYAAAGVVVPVAAQFIQTVATPVHELPRPAFKAVCTVAGLLWTLVALLRTSVTAEYLHDMARAGSTLAALIVRWMLPPVLASEQLYSYGLSPAAQCQALAALMLAVFFSCGVAALCTPPAGRQAAAFGPLAYLQSMSEAGQAGLCGVACLAAMQLVAATRCVILLAAGGLADPGAALRVLPPILLQLLLTSVMQVACLLYVLWDLAAPALEAARSRLSFDGQRNASLQSMSSIPPVWRSAWDHMDESDLMQASYSIDRAGSGGSTNASGDDAPRRATSQACDDAGPAARSADARLEALAGYRAFMAALDASPKDHTLRDFMQGTAHALCKMFPHVYHASLCLVSLSAPPALDMYTFLGEGAQKPPRANVRAARTTILHHVMTSCTPLFLDNIAQMEGSFSDVQFLRFVLGVRSIACLPLLAPTGDVLGVLRIGYRHRHEWTERDQAMAKQVALTLGTSHTQAASPQLAPMPSPPVPPGGQFVASYPSTHPPTASPQLSMPPSHGTGAALTSPLVGASSGHSPVQSWSAGLPLSTPTSAAPSSSQLPAIPSALLASTASQVAANPSWAPVVSHVSAASHGSRRSHDQTASGRLAGPSPGASRTNGPAGFVSVPVPLPSALPPLLQGMPAMAYTQVSAPGTAGLFAGTAPGSQMARLTQFLSGEAPQQAGWPQAVDMRLSGSAYSMNSPVYGVSSQQPLPTTGAGQPISTTGVGGVAAIPPWMDVAAVLRHTAGLRAAVHGLGSPAPQPILNGATQMGAFPTAGVMAGYNYLVAGVPTAVTDPSQLHSASLLRRMSSVSNNSGAGGGPQGTGDLLSRSSVSRHSGLPASSTVLRSHHSTASIEPRSDPTVAGMKRAGNGAITPQSSMGANTVTVWAEAPTDLKLLEVIGRGGFGNVYKAIWKGDVVAVKVLEHGDEFQGCADSGAANGGPGRKLDLHGRRAALLEGAMTSTINHPNVVATYDYRVIQLGGRDGPHQGLGRTRVAQETHIVMEFCDKGSLQDALQDGAFLGPVPDSTAKGGAGGEGGPPKALDLDLVCMTLWEVAAAMEYLHTHHITHRDLKPKNVLLRSSSKDRRGFVAKVSDFGLSQVLLDAAATQVTRNYSGTVTHMPPELIEDGKVYPQGDVYAFGIMMWEAYTGRSPYPNMAHPQIMVAVVTHNLRPRFPEGVPDWYKALAYRCWAKEPKTRPSFREISAILASHINDKGWRSSVVQLAPPAQH